jgi:NAD(P)-dependent dehydrogenase (short-subunit alcohol dehydrogenase family)
MTTRSGGCVVITGAKGGLGTYVTKAFLDAGAAVVGISPSIAASDFSHSSFTALPGKLSSGEATRSLLERATQKMGRIDVIVHLVGGFAGGTGVEATDDATFERMVDMNFRSAFYVIRAALPQMRAQRAGSILAVGSRTALEPAPMAAAYGAAKAALVAFVRTVAKENAEYGITANVILPGTMDTPANRAAMPGADFSSWVPPSQVAALLVHFASPHATSLTGTAIPVYGKEL